MAQASARIGLEPLEMILPARNLTAQINVINHGKKPVTFQAELLAWSQVNGEEVLTPTKDLIVQPPVFQLPVDGIQAVRVGRLKRVTAGPVEKTYRLVLSEIPPEVEAQPDMIATALRVTLPVLLPPATPLPPTFSWQAGQNGTGLVLAVSNAGNMVLRVRNLALRRGAETLATRPFQFAVLPGATMKVSWTDLPPNVFNSGALDVETTLNTRKKEVRPVVIGSLPAPAGPQLPAAVIPTPAALPATAPRP